MSRLEWNATALADLDRLESFLNSKNPLAAERAIKAIKDATRLLATFPDAGQHYRSDYRQLIVRFSSSGYIVLYRLDNAVVEIVRVRHMRETDY
ncbi:MAG: type II toxin-antitoxin system RelE/ParE family toxin [Devosia sp.]